MKLPARATAFAHCFLIAGLVLSALPACAVTVEQIPSPRPSGWTVDLTRTLPAATVAELDRLGEEVKAKSGAELAIVVVDTTGSVEPREFATRLFNYWGIGERGKDNGLLVFAALDDRAAEIVLGDGVDNASQVRASEEIMEEVMVPRFREGDPAGALLQGATACASRILGVSPVAPADPRGPKPSPGSAEAPLPSRPLKAEPSKASPAPARQPPPSVGELVLGCFLLLLMVTVPVAGLVWLVWLMVRPKRCPKCRTKMVLLSEAQDDAHLQPSERAEESIGSVNYKVWLCPACGEVKKTRRGALTSTYTPCPSCSARTLQAVSRTIQAADYDNGGLVQVDESCAHCAHRRSHTYATPQLRRPAPAVRTEVRSFSSSRSSFFSSSSSSSSSSSRSGFGGGRSSGGSGGSSSGGGGKSSGKGSSGRW